MANSANLQTFNTAFPFDVQIKNQYQQEEAAVFYIVSRFDPNDPAQQVEIDLKVNDKNSYVFKGFTNISPATTDANQYHIAIAIRPGAITKQCEQGFTQALQNSLTNALQGTGNICVTNGPIVRSTDGALIWYCVFNKDITLTAETTMSFMLQGIAAEPGVGSRSTQLEFMFSNISNTSNSNPISFQRSQHVDIINHQGHSYVPLYFGVLGENTLMNQQSFNNKLKIYSHTIDNGPLQFGEYTEMDFIFNFGDSANELMFFGNKSEVIEYSLDQNLNIPFPLLEVTPPYVVTNQNETNSQETNAGQICLKTTFQSSPSLSNLYTSNDLVSQWSIGQALFCGYANYMIGNQSTIPVSFQMTKDQFSIEKWHSIIEQFLPGIPNHDDNNTNNVICQTGLPDLTWGFQQQWWGWTDTSSSFDNVNSGFDSGNYFSDVNFFNYVDENFDKLLQDFFALNQGLSFSYPVNLPNYIYPCRYIYDYWFCSYNNYVLNLLKSFYNDSEYLNSKNLVFDFSNIQLSGLDGVVMLQVNVRNVPGYWDSEFLVPIIKKAPLLPFSNFTNAANLPSMLPVGSTIVQQGENGVFALYPGDNTTQANVNGIPKLQGTWVIGSQFWSDNAGSPKRYTYVMFVKVSNEPTSQN